MAFGSPPAHMGFVGYIRFEFPGETIVVRALSCDVGLKQEITKPDVIDGRFDKSLYQLGPKIVNGSLEYPAVMGDSVDATARLYQACVGRQVGGDRHGRLKGSNLFDLSVRYTSQFANFRYKNCIVNTWRFSAAQSDIIRISSELIGQRRVTDSIPVMIPSTLGYPNNSRIATWNDVVCRVIGERGAPDIEGDFIRNFECNINNNAEYYYTFNGLLEPQDIAVRKRDIDGSMTLMGRHEGLGEHARTNQDRCLEETKIQFGYQLNTDLCEATLLITMPNVVFMIEELALTNEVFETTVNWLALPDDASALDEQVITE